MSYAYPASDLDRPQALLRCLGSFWERTYDGRDVAESLLAAKLALARQVQQDFAELLDSTSRLRVPLCRRQLWRPITLTESERNAGDAGLPRFGDPGAWDESPYRFDVPADWPQSRWAAPADLVAAPLLCNRITHPSRVLVAGVDYRLQDGQLVFFTDPFADELIPKETIFADGQAADRQLTLWAAAADSDQRALQRLFGYALELDLPSTPAARDLANALFDALTAGSSLAALQAAWSAISGVPLAAGDETVERIWSDSRRLLILTSRRVYAFDPAARPLVSAGQALVAGQALTDALQIFEFNRGQVPAAVNALALGSGFLASGFFADLVFENRDLPLTVGFDAEGYTRLSWPLGGWPADVENFFDQLHARGRALGQTLAQLLDQRPADRRDSQPTAGALPATINPFAFLCQEVLRHHAVLVKLRSRACRGGVGLAAAKILRQVLPPQTAMLVLVELEASDEAITMEAPGTAQKPGGQETAEVYLGQAVSEVLNPSSVTENLRLYAIGGRCV